MRVAHVGFTIHLREEIMRKMVSALALALIVVTPALADDAKTIAQQIGDKWIAAYNKKDAAALTALYTADAVLMPNGVAQPIIGTDNIRKYWEEFVKQPLANAALPVSEANMLNPTSLYSLGTWSADAGEQHITGTWMSVFVQDGGTWKYRADTWNMMPPPAPAAASATTNK
jgi:uncharacterized protein (TIGR02246 family)